MYINTDMYKDDIGQNEAIWGDYEREIKQDFELEKYWRDGSCPTFYPFELKSDGYCSETESFEGAEIQEFSCDGKKKMMEYFFQAEDSELRYPNMKRARCMRKNGKLDWDIEMSSTCQR